MSNVSGSLPPGNSWQEVYAKNMEVDNMPSISCIFNGPFINSDEIYSAYAVKYIDIYQ